MLDIRHIQKVIQEQRDGFASYARNNYCHRMEERQVDINSPLAQVVVGVRRSGKSVMCQNLLFEHPNETAYANFDDERLANISVNDLDTLLSVLYKEYGDFKYLFLDEVQNVEGWHLFVNRLLRQGMHCIITGSNAKLLSSELATHLTGRHMQIELYPLSFAEFCECKSVDTKRITTKAEAFRWATYDEYLKQGGFPELIYLKNKAGYIATLFSSILERDIITRFKIKNAHVFIQLAHHLMNISPVVVSEKELAGQFGIASMTVGNYIEHLKQAYLMVGIKRYSAKSRLRVRNEKLYPIDVAFMDGRPDAMVGENLGWRLETQVLLELLRRNRPKYRDVYYFRERDGIEADFVVCQGNKVQEIYQVSYDISKEKTRKRELRGLMAAAKVTKCDNLYLITDTARETLEIDGKVVKVMPAYEWLLA